MAKNCSSGLKTDMSFRNSVGCGLTGIIVVMFYCCGTVFAQQKEPVRAPFFQGEALPLPPEQNGPWSHNDDAFSNAAAVLFEQGLANPVGLEYREIEIAVGNPWDGGGYPIKTHGWILPKPGKDGQFAIAWNGLVYPVIRVGDVADVHQDLAPDAPAPKAGRGDYEGVFFSSASLRAFSLPILPAALLLRLGEVDAAARTSKLIEPHLSGDPYLTMTNDWAWFTFARAVCAHERGDDRLALADARLLTKVQPLIEAEAKRRGFKPTPNFSSRNPGSTRPYLPFLDELPALLADCERRVADRENPPPPKKGIAALIDDLQNVDARQWGQPGGVSLAQDARVQVLVGRGKEAAEPLLAALENDTRLTRSVSFGRDFARERHLISVSDAAYAALADFLHVHFKTYDEHGQSFSRKALAAQIRDYWVKMGALTDAERFYATLKDDKAGEDQWLQAAANLVRLHGESLRDGRAPSVSQLLAQRSDDIAAIRTHSTRDHFLYVDAGLMALHLSEWDKSAAIPTLKKRLARAWSIGSEPHDILAFNSNPAEFFGSIIAQMTLARASCGDDAVYDEYAAWIQKADLKNVYSRCDELQKPLIQGAARPSIAKAVEYLFNDPQSPWSNVMAQGNGFWMPGFWQTPLPNTTAFHRQALRGLADKTLAGTITFNPPKDWDTRMEAQIQMGGLGMGFRGSNGDPDTPTPGQKCSFRVCDAYAYFYAKYQKGPTFQLFWPETNRDAGVLACQHWLEATK
jgi:hypothetical protein